MANTIKIHNAQTGEIIERQMNAEELAEMNKLAQEKAEAATAKAALLEKLGITEEEAKLLLS